MPPDKGAHLRAVLLLKHRARDVSDAPARLDQRSRAVERRSLLLQTRVERARPHPPFSVGVASPGADTGARRVDQYEVHAAVEFVELRTVGPWRVDLHIVRAGSLQPLMDWRETALVIVSGVDLALARHRGGQRQRLAAGAGAQVDHL